MMTNPWGGRNVLTHFAEIHFELFYDMVPWYFLNDLVEEEVAGTELASSTPAKGPVHAPGMFLGTKLRIRWRNHYVS